MRRHDLVNPFDMFHDLDKHFNFFLKNGVDNTAREFIPKVAVDEKEDFFHLSLEVPGIKKEDLDVELNDASLIIRGEKKSRFQNKDGEFESLGSFERRFSLPDKVNLDEIEVKHEHGVLDVIIPKILKTNTSRKLEIKDDFTLS